MKSFKTIVPLANSQTFFANGTSIFNRWSERKENLLWNTFVGDLLSLSLGDGFGQNSEIGESDSSRIMCIILGGQIQKSSSIQLSFVQQEFEEYEVERTSFLGNVTKRQVRLLECGFDWALIIPYLNKYCYDLTMIIDGFEMLT